MRIGYFIISLMVSGFLAYIFSAHLPGFIDALTDGRLGSSFRVFLNQGSVLYMMGFLAIFGLFMLVFSFILPSLRVLYYLMAAKSKISDLPNSSDNIEPIDLSDFSNLYKSLGFMDGFLKTYIPYLKKRISSEKTNTKKTNLKTASEKISETKNALKIQITANRNIYEATLSAKEIFHLDYIMDRSLFLWFFNVLPRAILGGGGIVFSIYILNAFLDLSVGGNGFLQISAAVTGLFYALVSGIIMIIVRELFTGSLREKYRGFIQEFDRKFHQIDGSSVGAVDPVLLKALNNFMDDVNKKSKEQTSLLQESLEICASTAESYHKALKDHNDKVTTNHKQQAGVLNEYMGSMKETILEFEKATEISHQTLSKLIGERNTVIDSLRECFGGITEAAGSSSIMMEKFNKISGELDGILQRASAANLGVPSMKIPKEVPDNIDVNNLLSEVSKLKKSFEQR